MSHFKKHISNTVIITLMMFLFSINGYSQNNYDIGVTEIISPTQVCEGTQEWLTVKVENFGTEVVDSFMLVWDINGISDSTWVFDSINVYPNLNYINVNVDIFTIDSGMNLISVNTKLPNNISDQDPSNDSITDNIQELYPEITYLNYCSDYLTAFVVIEKQNSQYVLWGFGDGTSDSTNNDTVVHVYPWTGLDSTFYHVTVTCYNFCGNNSDSSIEIKLQNLSVGSLYPCFVGINNTKEVNEVNIFPNPSSDVLNIEFLRLNTKPMTLQLFNANGILVFLHESTVSNANFNTQIDVSEFPKGLYFLRVGNGEGFQTHKIVIN